MATKRLRTAKNETFCTSYIMSNLYHYIFYIREEKHILFKNYYIFIILIDKHCNFINFNLNKS